MTALGLILTRAQLPSLAHALPLERPLLSMHTIPPLCLSAPSATLPCGCLPSPVNMYNTDTQIVVTQQTINNKSYNYSPNYSIFPEVIRDTFVSCDLGATVVTFAYVRGGQ
jgi:hypothetical protein